MSDPELVAAPAYHFHQLGFAGDNRRDHGRLRFSRPSRARNRPTGIFDGAKSSGETAGPIFEGRSSFSARPRRKRKGRDFETAARKRERRSSIGQAGLVAPNPTQ